MRHSVAVALEDIGSVEYILPALTALRELTVIQLFVRNGSAAERRLSEADEQFFNLEDANLECFNLVMCGTSGKAPESFRSTHARAMAADVQTLWFGDFFGSGSESRFEDLSPHAFAAFDPVTAGAFLRPRDRSIKVSVVGNPAFDRFGECNYESLRRVGRNRAGMRHYERYVHYALSHSGQMNHARSFSLVGSWLREQKVKATFSLHPAETAESREKLTALISAEFGSQLVQLPTGRLSKLELLAASDVFLVDYSTAGVEAAVLGTPTAFLLLPEAAKYQESRGLTSPFFPRFISPGEELTPAVGIFSEETVKERLTLLLESDARSVRRRQMNLIFPFLTDWQAAYRLTSFIEQLLHQRR